MKFAYLPILAVTLIVFFIFPAAAAAKIGIFCNCRKDRSGKCGFGICDLIRSWSEHAEEWYHHKPILVASGNGLVQEDGGAPNLYLWSSIKSVTFHRRIPPWRTGGQPGINPPFWLEIKLATGDENKRIIVWPREVNGGLLALRRFALTMAQHMRKANGQAGSEHDSDD